MKKTKPLLFRTFSVCTGQTYLKLLYADIVPHVARALAHVTKRWQKMYEVLAKLLSAMAQRFTVSEDILKQKNSTHS